MRAWAQEAVVVAIVCGALLYLLRRWMKRRSPKAGCTTCPTTETKEDEKRVQRGD